MAYKGRREASRPEKGRGERGPHRETVEDPFATPSAPDPFAEEQGPGLRERWTAYWDSGKGKILTASLGCLAVFIIVVVVVLKMWIKPPTLPSENVTPTPPAAAKPVQPEKTADEPEGPTDDELYPDDGYDGDMPTVSGNRKEGVYTFLLVGTDKGDGNTDTIMVASYDTKEQDVNIMSIPRDTMVNERWDIKKINSIYSRTGNSVDSLAGRIQKLVGFKPDFYVKVDLSMFVELVDLIGGVEFDVPQDMNYDDPYQDLHIHLKKGVQTLDGEHAMQLVRFRRYSEGDIKRVEVQQNFMKALIKECLSIQHWGKIKAYIDLAMENVETDLEFGSVVWFASNALGLNGAPALNMNDVYTCTLPGDYWGSAWSRDTNQEQSYVTIYPKQVVELVNERFNPYEQRVSTSMLDAMSILSNGDIASSTGSLRDTRHNAVMAVRRGEAYYDDDGNLVYGKPPAKPEQDEEGRYFILDESGNPVYTDEKGTPLEEPALPGTVPGDDLGLGDPVTLPQLPGTPSDTNQEGGEPPASDPGIGGSDPAAPVENPEPPTAAGEGETPAAPTSPPTDPAATGDPSGGTGSGEPEPPVEPAPPEPDGAGIDDTPPGWL